MPDPRAIPVRSIEIHPPESSEHGLVIRWDGPTKQLMLEFVFQDDGTETTATLPFPIPDLDNLHAFAKGIVGNFASLMATIAVDLAQDRPLKP